MSSAGAAATYTDTIGPVQIGVVTQNLSPVITSVPTASPYNPASFLSAADPVLNIAGKNFLQYPAVNSNNFIPSQAAGAQRIRCDSTSIERLLLLLLFAPFLCFIIVVVLTHSLARSRQRSDHRQRHGLLVHADVPSDAIPD